MEELKLIALDGDDLAVISAHLQDAVVRVGDLTFDRQRKQFVAVVNRFDWIGANERKLVKRHRRQRAGLRFERVLSVRSSGVESGQNDQVLALLAMTFEKEDGPAGKIVLHFSGGPVIELTVECVEAELRDLGAAWTTALKPRHSTLGRGKKPTGEPGDGD